MHFYSFVDTYGSRVFCMNINICRFNQANVALVPGARGMASGAKPVNQAGDLCLKA